MTPKDRDGINTAKGLLRVALEYLDAIGHEPKAGVGAALNQMERAADHLRGVLGRNEARMIVECPKCGKNLMNPDRCERVACHACGDLIVSALPVRS